MRRIPIFIICIAATGWFIGFAQAAPVPPSAAVAAPATAPLTKEQQLQKELATVVTENAVQAPFQRFLMIRQGVHCVALRIIEHLEPKPFRSRYEWYSQDDGSQDFKKANVKHGSGEVYEKRASIDYTENLIIKAGSFRLVWSASDWIYFPDLNLDSLISMARTNWTRLSDVNAHIETLHWVSGGKLVSWGAANAGLQLGIVEDFMPNDIVEKDASWHLLVRNVSDKLINVVYFDPSQFDAHAIITDAQGRKIQVMTRYIAFPVSRTVRILKPGETFKICEYNLHIGPDKDNWSEGITAPPGKYSVTILYALSDYNKEGWQGVLKSGALPLIIRAGSESADTFPL